MTGRSIPEVKARVREFSLSEAQGLAQTVLPLIDGGEEQTRGFDAIHRVLSRDASNQAADAVLTLIGQKQETV